MANLTRPPSSRPNTGDFLLRIDSSQKTVQFSQYSGSGGSHQFLWFEFKKLIDEVLNSSSKFSTDYQDHIISLTNLIDILTSRGQNSGSWLSFCRNDISYKLNPQVWFPYQSLKMGQVSKLLGKIERFNQSRDFKISTVSKTDLLLNFLEACAYVTNLMIKICSDLMSRNPHNRSFLKQGFHRIHNQI